MGALQSKSKSKPRKGGADTRRTDHDVPPRPQSLPEIRLPEVEPPVPISSDVERRRSYGEQKHAVDLVLICTYDLIWMQQVEGGQMFPTMILPLSSSRTVNLWNSRVMPSIRLLRTVGSLPQKHRQTRLLLSSPLSDVSLPS